jgi:hypothetical protein
VGIFGCSLWVIGLGGLWVLLAGFRIGLCVLSFIVLWGVTLFLEFYCIMGGSIVSWVLLHYG